MNRHRAAKPLQGIETLEARRLLAAASGNIDFSVTHQTMEGNGAAIISWVGHNELPEYANASFYDSLVNDLGVTAVRGPVWPNFETANDNNDPNVFNWSGYSSVQLQNVMTFFQRLKERGVNTFLLTVWTPPYWMKTNNSLMGGGMLRPDMREEYAEYLAAVVIAAKRDFGIDVSAISVQNEQFFNQWYESSLLDDLAQRDTVIAVQKKFRAEGLTTKIMANEDVGGSNSHRWRWYNEALLADPQIDRSQLLIGAHTTPVEGMPHMADQLEGTGVGLWFTEVSGRPNNWWDALMTTVEASDGFVEAGASAYFHWQFSDGPNSQTSSLMNRGTLNEKGRAIKHLFKYIQPGMKRVDSSENNSQLYMGAYKDPNTGSQTITLVNMALTDTQLTLNLNNFLPGSVFRVYESTQFTTWVQQPSIAAASTISLNVPRYGVVTLYSGQDKAPVSGQGVPVEPPIFHIVDPVRGNPLRVAVSRGRLADVQALIADGANVNESDPTTGWTPLHIAASSPFPDSLAIMNELLAAGANPLAVDWRGATTLHAVTMNLWPDWEPDVNASMGRGVAKINLLLARGVNINALDNDGRTPLHWAAMLPNMYNEYGHDNRALVHLLNNGANKAILDENGRSAYDYATLEWRQSYIDQLRWPAPFYDTMAPTTRYAAFNLDANAIDLTFSENVTASLAAGDIVIRNLATNQLVTGWTLSSSFAHGITRAKVQFAARLPDGRYQLSLAAGAIADQNNIASTAATTLQFNAQHGDATGDGVINFDDLLVVVRNFGKSNARWTSGDFNSDGRTGFEDLLILAQRYSQALTFLPAPPKRR